MRKRTRAWLAVGLAGALAGVSVLAASAPAEEPTAPRVHTASSGFNSERVKTVPITRRARDGHRVAMSISPERLGTLEGGERVEAMSELEVSTTCRTPMPKCVGKTYHFSPAVRARIVLSRAASSARGAAVSAWRALRCSQALPHRNHHCVLVIPSAKRLIADAAALPCPGGRCHLNLVVGADHPRAKRGHKLVVGADTDHGISQNKGLLSAAVFRPASARAGARTLIARTPRARALPIGHEGASGTSKRVVFSQKLKRLRAGERLVVDAKAVGSIGHLDYPTLVQSQLILSDKPLKTKQDGGKQKRIATFKALFGMANGFNCTQGPSAHSTPCAIRKVGVMRIKRNAKRGPKIDYGRWIPLYANLVVGARAVGMHGHRRRSGDEMRIKGGYLKVRRYRPAAPAAAPADE